MARRSAVQALYQWDLTGQSPTQIEEDFLSGREIQGVDLEYFQQLIRNIPAHVEELDRILGQCLDRDLATVDPVERVILRMGAYELRFRPEIPSRVVLNEAIKISQIFGAEKGYRFVNGVLDQCQAICKNTELPTA